MNKALFLGRCRVNNSIIPDTFEYYWQPPQAVYDPVKARQLLAEAGYPKGFDAGPFWCDSSYTNIGEVAVNNFYEVGIRTKLHPIERAGFAAAYAGKKYTRGVLRGASGAFGNAATRLAAFAVTGGSNVYGSYPDIDALYPLQADELDPRNALPSSNRCRGWSTKGRFTRRSGSWRSSTASERASASRRSAASPASPTPHPMRT